MTKIATPLLLLSLAACGTEAPADGMTPGETGAKLSIDWLGDTDVVGFHFEVERVACDEGEEFEAWEYEANVDLMSGKFPSGIEMLDGVLDGDSTHIGSDLFLALPPGCYDVTATPASEFGEGDEHFTPSTLCSTATETDVEVVDGFTTEVLLISTCLGDENGALDTLVLLNKAPAIIASVENKFVYECEAATACVQVFDPNDNPIDIDWEVTGDAEPVEFELSEMEIVDYEAGYRIWEQCATIAFEDAGDYEVYVEAHDAMGDGTWYEDYLGEDSSADVTFPIYVGFGDEPLCFDEDGVLGPVEGDGLVRVEECDYTSDEEYYCSGLYDIDEELVGFICLDGELIDEAFYDDCPVS